MEINARQIIDLSLPIIRHILTDEKNFENSINNIKERIDDPPRLIELLQMAQNGFDEETILNIAAILFDASNLPYYNERGIHMNYKPAAFSRYPALIFFEYAATKNSSEGLYRAATIWKHGGNGINPDEEKAAVYIYRAAQSGHLKALSACSDEQLAKLIEEGLYWANIPLFIKYYYTFSQQKCKECLDDLIAHCSPTEIETAIKYILQSDYLGTHKFDSAVSYLRQESTSFSIKKNAPLNPAAFLDSAQQKKGCYIATYVYGSYDCSQVWTLRRFRDDTLSSSWYGRKFIRLYYAISPKLIRWFGKTRWFKNFWQAKLDKLVAKLQENGVKDTPYEDKNWR